MGLYKAVLEFSDSLTHVYCLDVVTAHLIGVRKRKDTFQYRALRKKLNDGKKREKDIMNVTCRIRKIFYFVGTATYHS